MKNYKLTQVLKEMGLNDKESVVYLAALSLGPTTVLKLASNSGIKRTSIYSIVESLKAKGLMNIEITGFKARYVAAPPAALKAVLSNRITILENCMPEFIELYNATEDYATIRQYEGLSAIKGLYEELLDSVKLKDDYLVLTDLAKWENLDARFFNSFVRRRENKQLKLRILSVPSKQALRRHVYDRQRGGYLRFLPEGLNLSTNLIITPKHVVFHQLVPPMDAIVLNNKRVINLQTQMFNIIWEQSRV